MQKLLIGLVLICALTFSACHGYQIHPGSINKADSVTYDALIIAQAVIEKGKEDRSKYSGPVQQALDNLIKGYNIARTDWRFWRAAVSAGAETPALKASMLNSRAGLATLLTNFETSRAAVIALPREQP